MQLVPDEDIARYTAPSWWPDTTAAELLRDLRRHHGQRTAYITPQARASWFDYDELADRIGKVLTGSGLARGERVGVFVPAGLAVHAAYIGASRAGDGARVNLPRVAH